MSLTRRRLGALALAAWLAALPASAGDEAPVIAAAANIEFVLAEIAAAFTAATGRQVRLAFGSTGNIARQIREGAPFQMFMAADDETPLALAGEGLTRDDGALYAVGRLALVAPEGSPLDPASGLAGVGALLAEGRLARFAIANPEHAPYGRRAEEALRAAGLWDALQPHLVLGENVTQAAQFALSGNAEGGIVAYPLTLAPEFAGRGRSALLPDDGHAPLAQRMVLLGGAGPVAEAFYAFVGSPEAGAILARHGFALPD